MATLVALLLGLETWGAAAPATSADTVQSVRDSTPRTEARGPDAASTASGGEYLRPLLSPAPGAGGSGSVPSALSRAETGRPPLREFSFGVWDDGEEPCLRADFRATFSIFYRSQSGHQNVIVRLPSDNTRVKGICASDSQNPILQIFWQKFSFSLIFFKLPRRDKEGAEFWGVKSAELTYDTSGPLFDKPIDAGNKSATFLDDNAWLEIPLNKSYYCPSPEVLYLYDNKKEKVVAVTLKDVEIQPYGVVDGRFSEAYRCNQVSIGSEPQIINRDETVPIAVGSTFAILTLIGVSGYAVYRTITARRVDYSTME